MPDIPALVDRIETELRAVGSREQAVKAKQYLKSALTHFGSDAAALRRVVRAVRRAHPDLARADLVKLVEKLWEAPIFERRAAAVELLVMCGDRLAAGDIDLVERLVRESKTWALVDSLAATVAGRLVERFPALAPTLDRWARDPDFWVRRSAMLALLRPLRRGEGDFERFARYAEGMLEEKEFFIRKAIGWILREVSKKRPDLVHAWLAPRAHRASGVTVREAVKYLAPAQRERIEANRAAGRYASSSRGDTRK